MAEISEDRVREIVREEFERANRQHQISMETARQIVLAEFTKRLAESAARNSRRGL